MSNQTKNNNLNYLIDPFFLSFVKSLFYHLKMKLIELLFQNTMYQKLK